MSQAMKNVVITGSSSGFGEGAAKAFADIGYRVWATMRDANGRNATKKSELESYVDEINALSQPIQDSLLKNLQLDSVLGGVSA